MKILVVYHTCIAQYFSDIAEACALSFNQLGHQVVIQPMGTDDLGQVPSGHDLVFVIGMHAFHQRTIPQKSTLFVGWEYEQLTGNDAMNKQKQYCFQLSAPIFDFIVTDGAEKVDLIKSFGYRAFHLPLGYHALFDYQVPSVSYSQRYIDVLFYGTMTKRRHQLLEALFKMNLCCGVVDANSQSFINGHERAQFIANAKICLNIHVNDTPYFEQHRIIKDYICNHGLVITETLPSTIRVPGVEQESYNFLSARVASLLSHDNFEQIAEENARLSYEYVRTQYRLVDHLQKMLTEIKEST